MGVCVCVCDLWGSQKRRVSPFHSNFNEEEYDYKAVWTKTQENCDASTKLGIKYDKTAVNGEGLNEKGNLDSQVLKTETEVTEDAYRY